MTGARHIAWAALGGTAALGLWFAYSVPGAIAMFASIALAFVMWNKLGSRGSWMALIVLGLGMGGVLGWQAMDGARCPEGDTKIFLKENKAPVGCDEIRASAGSMAMFFLIIASMGIAAPLYARGQRDEDDDETGADGVV